MATVRKEIQQRVQQGLNLSKAERKILRKKNRALQTMKTKAQEVGEISQRPTPYLLVKNGGLMCGVKRRDLFSVLHRYGSLEDLVMLPGKSYSYALFLNVESAEKAMTNLNGQKILSETYLSHKTLYLAYLVKKPCFQMCSLDKSYPSGLLLIEDFIDELEESVLLMHFSNANEMGQSQCFTESTEPSIQKQLRHRYVKHYGYEFLYGSNTVDIENPLPNGMPQECLPVIEKITSLECVKHRPDQLTINEYLPGQGIPPHIDTHSAFEDGIICLSLGAKVSMDFRHPDGRHVPVLLPKRSVLVMTEDSRYVWTHGITPRKYDVVSEDSVTDHGSEATADTVNVGQQSMTSSSLGVTLLPRETRLSLTFRKVRTTPCDCKFPSYCDSRSHVGNIEKENLEDCPFVPVTEQDAIDLEKKHVYNVYENIAEHFSGTRHSPWPKIAEFLKAQPSGSLVADVGCGNGKYLGINDQLFMYGSDRSFNLASICRERGFQVIVCDILNLPYRSDAFDVCICIAVIHHLSTPDRRLAALKELTRIVRPGGRILVSVWALEQNLKNAKAGSSEDIINDRNSVATKSPNAQTSDTDSKFVNIPSSGNTGVPCPSRLCSIQQTGLIESLKENIDSSSSSRTSLKLKVNATRNKFEQQDLLVPWHYRGEKKRTQSNVELPNTASGLVESKKNEAQASSLNGELVFQRFYHVFKENELVDDCRKVKNISIVMSYYDRGNWCVELEKTGNS